MDYLDENGLPRPEWALHFLSDKASDLWESFPKMRSVWVPLPDEPRAGKAPSALEARPIDELFMKLKAAKEAHTLVFVGSFKLVALAKQCINRHA